MALIAALGMYDRPETQGPNDRFWALIRDALRGQGIDAPDALSRGDMAYMAGWLSPELLISQTCSLPLRAKLAQKVTLIATPDYGLAGCPAGYYRSVYVARRADGFAALGEVAGQRFAYNEALSHSGWAAAYADHAARGLLLRPSLCTGAHRASAQAVAAGGADYAAIDALTWDLIQRYDDFASQLVVIDHTPATPALPYVTAMGRDPAPLLGAMVQAVSALSLADKMALHLKGLVQIPLADYLALPIPPPPQG
jgi:ABC-type phosphate/phosphonate transport system substrate-binding protein